MKKLPRNRIEALGVAELVNQLLEANATYAEIQAAVKQATGKDVSDSALSRYRGNWSAARARLAEAQEQAQAIMGVLDAKPGTNFQDAAMSLLWTKLLQRMADVNATFEQADMVELGQLVLRAVRSGQHTDALGLQRERLELLKTKLAAVADDVTDTVKSAGLSSDVVKQIKEKILGVAA